MSAIAKILTTIGIILGVGLFGYVIYNQEVIKKQNTQLQSQIVAQQQLVDGIVRSQSQYASAADLAKFAADNDINLKAIQTNLQSLNSQLSSINVITADSSGQTATNVSSTSTGPANPNPVAAGTSDPFGYMKNEQQLALNEDFGTLKVPFGTVGFSAWQAAPWNINILPREYNVDTVVGVDANERQTFYNKFTVDIGGKTYDIPIKKATTEQQTPTASFSFWNPRLLIGMDGGVNVSHIKGEFTPHIDLGIMSYGQYKTTPDWSILEVGAGVGVVGKTMNFVLTPVAYNIGKKFFSPLMNNTYIGPSISVATDGSFIVGGGMRVGF
jgi:hypothetical protein